jgi:hypothetical protein
MVLALGPATPVLPVLYQVMPTVIRRFRYPEKFYFFVHFAAAMLAAAGAEALFRGDRRVRWIIGAATSALAAMAGLLFLIRWAWPASYLWLVLSLSESSATITGHVPLALDLAFKARRALLLLGAFVGLLLLRRASVLRAPIFSALVVSLVACDLASINHGLNHTVSWSALRAQAPVVDIAELRKTRHRVFDYETDSVPGQPRQAMLGLSAMIKLAVSSSLDNDSQVTWRVLRMNLPMIAHVGTLSGIDGIYRKSDDVLNAGTSVVPRDRAVKLLRIFGVEYLIGQSTLEVSGLQQVSTLGNPTIFVYRAEDPAPAVYLSSRIHPAGSDIDAFNQMIRAEFVPGTDATVDEVPPAWQEESVEKSPGEVRVIAWEDEGIDLEVHAAKPALLVLNDSFFPGWEARVDGSPTKIHRANALVRGVFLAAGDHRVEFSYRPKSFLIGVTISLATLLAAIVVGGLSKRHRSHRAPESAQVR